MDDIVSELRRTQKKSSGKVMRSSAYVPVQSQPMSAQSSVLVQTDIPAPAIEARSRGTLVRNGLIAATVLVLAVVAWILLAPSGISVNPNMTTRVLQVPFTQYSYPSLSPDGKWIAFPAADASGKWDIYYMHVNGGEPRKITSDATSFIQQGANISPDGSQIVYDRPNTDNTSYDIFAISALGGTSRKLATAGGSAQWRPDGQRVGFIRTDRSVLRSESGKMEFLTVAADGSDLRREFIDSLFVTRNYRYNFCWSPTGKSVAWIRTLSASSQVIILHDLESGQERRLTDGQENIDAMAWTVDDKIIFSSNRGGNTNLWAILASGGRAVQVTKGGGPDIALSIAASGTEFVYLQQQKVGYLWTANIDGSSLRQISFDEREIWEPFFSPDKQRIAFIMNDPDPLKTSSDVYVVDRDGNNRRRLTSGNPRTRLPVWSPDGRRIMYSVPPTGQGSDTGSARIFVVDVDNPGAPKFVGNHFGTYWLDNDHILAGAGTRSYIVTVSTAVSRRFFSDSLVVRNVIDGRSLTYYDSRRSKAGWWVVSIQPTTVTELLKQTADVIMPNVQGSPRKISSAPDFIQLWTSSPTTAGTILQYAGEDKVRLISPSGRSDEVLPVRFPGLRNRSFEMSRDGKEVVYVTPRLSSRLVLLENVFK